MSPVWSARPDSPYYYVAQDMRQLSGWPLVGIRETFAAGIFVVIFTKGILQLGMT